MLGWSGAAVEGSRRRGPGWPGPSPPGPGRWRRAWPGPRLAVAWSAGASLVGAFLALLARAGLVGPWLARVVTA